MQTMLGALVILLLSVSAAGTVDQPRTTRRSVEGPPEGRPDDVRAIARSLNGINKDKLKLPPDGGRIVDRDYLVALVEGFNEDQISQLVINRGGHLNKFLRGSAWNGASVKVPSLRSRQAALMQDLVDNPAVQYVEADQIVTASATQTGATWGIDRVDGARDTSYGYTSDGTDVCIYVVDTGVLSGHSEFTGRVLPGSVFVRERNTEDGDGHGTHVAGTAAGTVYGVAKQAFIIPVKVLTKRGSGTWGGVVEGINYVAGDARTECRKGKVINMSLGGGFSVAVNQAVANAVRAGVVTAVAAGNEGQNACNVSPASEPLAVTVGATNINDVRASWSNFGTCVDIFAPGVNIQSAWRTGGTNTISGTSMASPHVAGLLARLLSDGDCDGTQPSSCPDALKARAAAGVVGSAGTGSPNMLAVLAPGE